MSSPIDTSLYMDTLKKIYKPIRTYFKTRMSGLSVFGSTYHADWNFIVISFSVIFIALCLVAGVGYEIMITSAFPENLTASEVDTSTFKSNKALVDKAQAYMQNKTKQFDAAR